MGKRWKTVPLDLRGAAAVELSDLTTTARSLLSLYSKSLAPQTCPSNILSHLLSFYFILLYLINFFLYTFVFTSDACDLLLVFHTYPLPALWCYLLLFCLIFFCLGGVGLDQGDGSDWGSQAIDFELIFQFPKNKIDWKICCFIRLRP